jgi:hypothetical protein
MPLNSLRGIAGIRNQYTAALRAKTKAPENFGSPALF